MGVLPTLVPDGVNEGSNGHREPSLPPAKALTSCLDEPQLQLGLAKRNHVTLPNFQLQLKERRAPPVQLLGVPSPPSLGRLVPFHTF